MEPYQVITIVVAAFGVLIVGGGLVVSSFHCAGQARTRLNLVVCRRSNKSWLSFNLSFTMTRLEKPNNLVQVQQVIGKLMLVSA
jgi:hypothetical protein